ncbi:nitrilase family protein [candidate division KSB1 bacterium]|nr:nitrilase family protein [candidate division KSB1 bacterium]
MRDITIAAAQFENRSWDKQYNLNKIDELCAAAVKQGAKIVSFHELSITGYTFLNRLSINELNELAENVPGGDSTQRLINIAGKYDIAVLAGLVEKGKNNFYNTYICVTGDGVQAKFRKLHPFISPFLSAGDKYVVFDLFGCKCGILICYDNNIIENVRATVLSGAEILFAPHVTMCTPSPMPGRGFVDPKLWENRKRDPVSLRLEFDGPKGRRWLMRWLPARAYDNGIYIVFTNPIGMDDDQLKNGCSMILDPFGEVLVECRSMEDEVVTALCTDEKLTLAGGFRYKNARRPELYGKILARKNKSITRPVWLTEKESE